MAPLRTNHGFGGDRMQYSVYIYHRPSNENEKHANWELTSVTNDLRAAKKEAKSLFKSKKYKKVELQSNGRFPDPVHNINNIVKIYDENAGVKGAFKNFIKLLPEFMVSIAILTAFYFLL